MSEKDVLGRAQQLINQGKEADAAQLLWPLCESRNHVVRLNAVFTLLFILDPFKEIDSLIDSLIALVDKGIEASVRLSLSDERAYLLSRKTHYLLNRLSMLVNRAKNLTLSERMFTWIDFSLERDKEEYAAIQDQRAKIENEIASMAAVAEKMAEKCKEHRLRGQVFESIGDYYSAWFFLDYLDFQHGERFREKLLNLHFFRRWNLVYFLYDRDSRKKILRSKRKCFEYFERAVAEFEAANLKHDIARASYRLSTKLMQMNHFRRANQMLLKAMSYADKSDSKLASQISQLEQRIKERNSVHPNYVEDLGLDIS